MSKEATGQQQKANSSSSIAGAEVSKFGSVIERQGVTPAASKEGVKQSDNPEAALIVSAELSRFETKDKERLGVPLSISSIASGEASRFESNGEGKRGEAHTASSIVGAQVTRFQLEKEGKQGKTPTASSIVAAEASEFTMKSTTRIREKGKELGTRGSTSSSAINPKASPANQAPSARKVHVVPQATRKLHVNAHGEVDAHSNRHPTSSTSVTGNDASRTAKSIIQNASNGGDFQSPQKVISWASKLCKKMLQ